jgi:chromosome segregation ATPase
VLWVNKALFSWHSLSGVNNARSQARASKLFAGNEDVATVTNILVAHTLQTQNGDCKVLSESSARKHRLDEENEASKEARKKARLLLRSPAEISILTVSRDDQLRSHQDASYSQHQQQQSATISNLEGNSLNEQLCKQASIISGLEEDKAALKMSLDNERRMQATILAQKKSLDEQLRMQAGIIKRGGEENVAQQKLLDKQAATIADLEKEKAALESSLDEQQTTMMDLKTSLDERAAIIASLDSEKAALKATVEEGLRKNQVLKTVLTELKQKPQSAQLQLLDFMRETFGEEEVIQTDTRR